MNFEAAFLQPLREPFFHILRLLQTAAVNQSVIAIPAEGQNCVHKEQDQSPQQDRIIVRVYIYAP